MNAYEQCNHSCFWLICEIIPRHIRFFWWLQILAVFTSKICGETIKLRESEKLHASTRNRGEQLDDSQHLCFYSQELHISVRQCYPLNAFPGSMQETININLNTVFAHIYIHIYIYIYMGVSKNNGTPKSSICS